MRENPKSEISYIYTFESQNTHSVKSCVNISKKLPTLYVVTII